MAAEGAMGINPNATEPLYLDNTGHPTADRFALGLAWDDLSGNNNGQYAPFSWRSASSIGRGSFPPDRVLISTCLVVVTALAWVYLIHLDRERCRLPCRTTR